ncbi:MAG TPA: Spx/MgsR family RNA polymerase-binding regulatory protein [Saprospiraceae bacterium]|nr:Spx/MgsR family RNA polymerase-binding regulatory protein [Saprospiraceae bacterium]HRP83567.1 Spx/MgsR family RNA polymerase-binding regulatory protein [Saprospiraceae bacterium]
MLNNIVYSLRDKDMVTMIMYGIPNCNSVKKARVWLEHHNVEYTFHDYKKLGISSEKIEAWLGQIPLDRLLNKAGMTYRNLNSIEKESASEKSGAIAIMIEKPSVIKRPLIEDESGKVMCLGFSDELYEDLFNGK